MRNAALACALIATSSLAAPPAIPGARPVPYWASIAAGEARMRTGPGRVYPASWVYRRAGLPVQVIQVVPGWRKVRDPDGAEGWMIANLLTSDRGAYVREAGELRAAAGATAAVRWRIERGISARLESCAGGWCRIAVGDRDGFIEAAKLWGVAPDAPGD